MKLNLSSGRVNRSRGEITRVPEKVDPGRAVVRTRIVSPVELNGACPRCRQCSPWVRSVRPLYPCRCLAYWTSASIAKSQQPTPCARSRQRWPGPSTPQDANAIAASTSSARSKTWPSTSWPRRRRSAGLSPKRSQARGLSRGKSDGGPEEQPVRVARRAEHPIAGRILRAPPGGVSRPHPALATRAASPPCSGVPLAALPRPDAAYAARSPWWMFAIGL